MQEEVFTFWGIITFEFPVAAAEKWHYFFFFWGGGVITIGKSLLSEFYGVTFPLTNINNVK